jgi:2-polyprenyl-3-methyl-5-hydroxy-6-metoxy-1,4-benzoquinol methylase
MNSANMADNITHILNSSGYENYSDIKRLKFILTSLANNVAPNATVLDVGCGNGLISISMGKAGYNVYGIDISDKAIEKANAKNTLPNVKFDVVSAEEFAGSHTQYDAVVCSEVLEHLHDPGQLLKVLHRSLKDNGILIVTVPNGKGLRESLITKPVIALQKKNNWQWRALQKFKSALGYKGTTLQSDADDLTHVQFFTRKKLNELAAENNFSIINFGKTNFVENVFPFSFFANRIKILQKIDCAVAEWLPYSFTGAFVTVWQKAK